MDSASELTEHERAILEERRRHLPTIIADMPVMLEEFRQLVGMGLEVDIVDKPEDAVPLVDSFLRAQIFRQYDERSLIWLLTRVGYFVAHVLIVRNAGSWAIEERRDSPYFLRYVITDFLKARLSGMTVDPFSLANALAQPGNQGLAVALDNVYRQLDGLTK
ncbi:MAG: hypothetical protein OIN66_17115 [Candidatus Methanoperedens sp.]|nr:hypothetical protein [Candidatus Methanoperedens sp.]